MINISKAVLGFRSSSLYLNALENDLPCGEKNVWKCKNPKDPVEINKFITGINNDELFGFALVDIEMPNRLRNKLFEMLPLFLNSFEKEQKDIATEYYKQFPQLNKVKIPDNLLKYFNTKILKIENSLPVKNYLIYLPLLKRYLKCGVVITAIYYIEQYTPEKPFKQFANDVNDALQKALHEAHAVTLLSEILKKEVNNKRTDDALDTVFITCRFISFPLKCTLACHMAINQLVVLRIIEFYYDFLLKFIDIQDFELINVTINKIYISISKKTLDEIVKINMINIFNYEKRFWLTNNFTPGLFNLYFTGSLVVGINSHELHIVGTKLKKKEKVIMWEKDYYMNAYAHAHAHAHTTHGYDIQYVKDGIYVKPL